MSEFKKSNRFTGSNRPFSGGRPGGSRPYGPRSSNDRGFDGQKEMFKGECASCHKPCQVPFRPNGKKPVYCSDCFRKDDDRPQRPFREERSFGSSRPSFASPAKNHDLDDVKRQLASMSATLEKLLIAVENSNRPEVPAQATEKKTAPKKALSAAVKKVTKAPKKAAKKTKKQEG